LLGTNPIVTTRMRLKDIIAEYGWELAKDTFPEVRRLMQDLATEGVRDNLGEDIWLDAWQRSLPRDTVTERAFDESVVAEYHTYGHTATPDVRFPNEVGRVRFLGGVIWKVIRPGYLAPVDKHRSETEMTKIEPDALIVNNGTVEDLRREVHTTMTRYNIFAV
jgi:hypothetical protein